MVIVFCHGRLMVVTVKTVGTAIVVIVFRVFLSTYAHVNIRVRSNSQLMNHDNGNATDAADNNWRRPDFHRDRRSQMGHMGMDQQSKRSEASGVRVSVRTACPTNGGTPGHPSFEQKCLQKHPFRKGVYSLHVDKPTWACVLSYGHPSTNKIPSPSNKFMITP